MTSIFSARTSRWLLAASPIALSACATTAPRPVMPVETPAIAATAGDPAVIDRTVQSTIIKGDTPVPGTPRGNAGAPVARGNIAVNLPNADVGVVAKTVLGDILHIPFTTAAGASRPVTFVTPGPVSRGSLLGLFETALKAGGLALVPTGPGYTITTAQAANTPIGVDAIGFGSETIKLQFINSAELKKVLDPVVPGVVTAVDDGENSVTIAGTTGQRKSARDLIAQFDVNWLRGMSFGMMIPQRTDARLIAPELEKLINAPDSPTHGLVKIIAMERLNGILAISRQPQYLDDVRRWIEVLDRAGEGSEPRIFVYRVQNGRARDLAKTLNQAYTGGSGAGDNIAADPFADTTHNNAPIRDSANPPAQTPLSGAPKSGAAGTPAEATAAAPSDQARISADETNNAVIIYGTPKQYAVAESALRQLDIPPLQVLIEAAITEVSLTDDLRYGVQWNYVTGQSNFTLGEGSTSAPTRNLPGFSYLYSGNSITAALNALEQRTNLKVVSAPKLMVLNNQTAALQVGDQVPILTQSATSTIGVGAPTVNSVEYRDTGVILKVTPRVNASGLVQLDIAQEVSDVVGTTSSSISSPTISTRRVSTTIAVQDGQVIALGGLFRDSKSFGKNGLPILSRIPVLGSLLFGNTDNVQKRTELIILLKPHVVRGIEDAKAVTEELRAKIRTLEPFKTDGKIP